MQYKHSLEILSFCKTLADENLVKKGDCISVKLSDGSMLITDENKDMKDMSIGDIKRYTLGEEEKGWAILHRAVYKAKPKVNAIITNHAGYSTLVASVNKKLPAALDDMAQIVGPTAKVAKSSEVKDVLKALKRRNSCLIKDGGALTMGRTLDEAYTATMVLEKGAKVFVEATILGGAKIINYFESMLMHFIYKNKYSKADQTAKMEELK